MASTPGRTTSSPRPYRSSSKSRRRQEIDNYWNTLLDGGGRPDQCGWLQDKFGLSWQVIPKALPQLLSDPDPAKAKRALDAMLKMTKIDLAELQRAHAG